MKKRRENRTAQTQDIDIDPDEDDGEREAADPKQREQQQLAVAPPAGLHSAQSPAKRRRPSDASA